MKTIDRTIRGAGAALLALLLTAGCSDDAARDVEQGAEQVGDTLETAADRTGEMAADAAEEIADAWNDNDVGARIDAGIEATGDAAQDVADEISDAARKAKQKLESANDSSR